jgi:ABC-type nitrate/sulfonate/bicarbonate transport system permease component
VAAAQPGVARSRSSAEDPAGLRLRWEVGALIAGLLIWEAVGRGYPHLIPPVTQVWSALEQYAKSGALWSQLGDSLRELLIGYVVTMAVGVALGLVMGLSRSAARIADMYLNMMLSAPEIALIPFFIVVFGFSGTAQLVVVMVFALPVIAQRTVEGVVNVPRELVQMARSFEAGWLRTLARVILPASLPSIMVAARLGFARALLGVIAGGIFIQEFGLGGQIYNYEQNFDLPSMFTYLLLVVIVALAGARGIQWVDRRVTHWNQGATR